MTEKEDQIKRSEVKRTKSAVPDILSLIFLVVGGCGWALTMISYNGLPGFRHSISFFNYVLGMIMASLLIIAGFTVWYVAEE